MVTVNNVTTLHDQKQKCIVDMPKVINVVIPHEKINQPKSSCNLISEKENSIPHGVNDKRGSLSALAKPFCPYIGHSMQYLILQYYISTPSLSGAMQLTAAHILSCR